MEQLWSTYCYLGQCFVPPSPNNHFNANGTIFFFTSLILQSLPLLEPLPSKPSFPTGTSFIKKLLMNRTDYEIQFYNIGNITTAGKLASSGKFTIVHGGPEPGTEVTVVSGTATVAVTTGRAPLPLPPRETLKQVLMFRWEFTYWICWYKWY